MDLNIIPECYVDTNLLETLVPPQSRYNHQKGCGTVAKVMRERFADNFALGIVDKDKQEIDYLKEFVVEHSKGGLVLHRHQTRNHFIIQISPAVEQFILDAVELTEINMEDYNLPTSLERLKKVTKSTNSKEDPRFKKLFRQLRKIGGTDLDTLSAWIRYIRENPYAVDIEIIKSL